MHPAVVLCDLDGTLGDSLSCLYRVYEAFLEQYNLEASKDEFHGLIGPPISEVVETLQYRYVLQEDYDLLYKQYTGLMKFYLQSIPLMPGSRECIEKGLELGTVFYLVTAASRAYARRFVESHQLEKYFKAVIALEDAQFSKPHPAPYLQALALSGLTPEQAVAIEDSASGVASSTSAGVKTLWISPKGAKQIDQIEWKANSCKVTDWVLIQEILYGK